MNALKYMLISTASLSLLYLMFRLLFRKEANFKQLRFALLSIVVVSLLLPFQPFSVPFFEEVQFEKEKKMEIVGERNVQHVENQESELNKVERVMTEEKVIRWNWRKAGVWIYLVVSLFFVVRIILQMLGHAMSFLKAEKHRGDRYYLVKRRNCRQAYSFFNWIFVPENVNHEELDKILAHERIHVSQFHTIDLLLIELQKAVMWFNPLVWIMRRNIQLVHEYLADEGALGAGIDKLGYQALLLNQIAEEKLVGLSSNFNTLIKKRMMMINNNKSYNTTRLRILGIIPVILLVVFFVACIGGNRENDVIAAVAPLKMNVFYLGVDNPIKIAVSGYRSEDLEISTDNGVVFGSNGNYVIRPKEEGEANVIVSSKAKEIQRSVFRVKEIPTPVTAIDVKGEMKKGGSIAFDELLDCNGVRTFMQNFDFDIGLTVKQFTVSAAINGYLREETSNSSQFTEKQKKIIQSQSPDKRIYIQDIICADGEGREYTANNISLRLYE